MPLDRCKLSGIPFAASYPANKARTGSRAPNQQTKSHAAAQQQPPTAEADGM